MGKIYIEYMDQNETMSMNVTSEEPQEFQVYMDSPEYYYDELEGFTVRILAQRSMAEAVKGKASLRAEIRNRYSKYSKQSNRQNNVFRQTFDDFNHGVEFFMTKGQIRELGWQSWTDLTLELTATVTDGHRQTYTDVTMVELKRTNIKLDVVYRPQVIKPGMTYQSYIKVCEQDDKPLTSEDRERNDLICDVEYRYPIKGITDSFVFSANWAADLVYTPPKIEKYVMKIPENGDVVFKMDVQDDEFEYVSFRVSRHGRTFKRNENHLTVLHQHHLATLRTVQVIAVDC